jgi:hypothetical protein
MKKAVILILAFVLLSVSAFADFSWGMWGRTELSLLRGSSDTDDIISLWGPNWWTLGYNNGGPFMGFNLSWSNDTFGYNWSFQFQNWDIFGDEKGDDANFAGADVFQLNGTTKVIPDLLTLKIGLISEGGYNYNPPAAGDWGGKKHGDIWDVTGMMLTLAPADSGFKAMVLYRVPLNGMASNGDPIGDCAKYTDVCFQYTIPGTASITGGTLGTNNMVGLSALEAGRPIFATAKMFMIPNLNLDLSLQYNLANFIDEDDEDGVEDTASLSAILGVTYTLDALILKGAFWLIDNMVEDDAQINYRGGLNIEYTAGDFWIAIFNTYSHAYNQWSTEYEDLIEINPVIKHNPSGIQLGFYYQNNLTTEWSEWKVPLQIDFGF